MQARNAIATMRRMDSELDQRARAGHRWANKKLGLAGAKINVLAADASFRRYFRIRDDANSWVLMDAPPEHEDSAPFVAVSERLRQAGIRAPEIYAQDLEQGYLLLEDFGDTLLRERLNADSAEHWMPPLFDLLSELALQVDAQGLPAWDRPRLQEELDLFTDWYLERHLAHDWGPSGRATWQALCAQLIDSAEAQPQVFVHRDFHSCNLLLGEGQQLGVIDYQDAVRGPLSYDFASLLWDRYIHWPRHRIEAWTEQMRQRLAPERSPQDWQRDVDWMGLQRNLKIVGIFARLHYRDGKAGYLTMAPQFFAYLRDVLPRYPAFKDFDSILEDLPCAP